MKKRLEGKRVLLTGAAGFFGQVFTLGLLKAGAEAVYAVDSSVDKLAKMAEGLEAEEERARLKIWCFDQSPNRDIRFFTDEILAEGAVDVVINNAFDWKAAGFSNPSARIETISRELVLAGLEMGVCWPLEMIQPFIDSMKEKGAGNIVNIASMYGLVAPSPKLYEGRYYFNPLSYPLSKAAVVALTKYMAAWLGPEIRANALAPGAFPNYGKSDNSAQNQDVEFIQRLRDRTLLGRLGDPEKDLLGPLLFLASDESRYMTGAVLVVDGGWTVV